MSKQLKTAQDFAKAGCIPEAAKAFDVLLHAHPDTPRFLAAAADFHYRQSHQVQKAAKLADALVAKKPQNADYRVLAAEIFLKLANRGHAKLHADAALAIAPQALNVLTVNAAVAFEVGDFAQALDFVNQAEVAAPDDLGVQYQKARILVTQGELQDALVIIETILEKRPDAIEALGVYIQIKDLSADDPQLIKMREKMLPHFVATKDPRLAKLLKLLGKAHDAVGLHDAAFSCFSKAKALEPMLYNPKVNANFVEQLCTNVQRSDYFARGHATDAPVFVIGMPRCGSTLLEQVLTGHPQIASAGESPSLRRIVTGAGVKKHDGARMAKAIKQMPPDAAQKLGARYLNETHQKGAMRVIDKSLHNFELLGFMAAMMPKARIIHVLRDPMDNCTSCYLQLLPASHQYTQSLQAIGHAYRLHRRLMDHWAKVLPNQILTVRYEDLVGQLEGTARTMVDFVGLEWDAACLDFQSNTNQVKTISVKQVRQPLYTSSMQRWRHYDAHLAPLKSALTPFYPNGFDQPYI